MSRGAEGVFNTIVPPGVTPFMQQLYDAGFTNRGGQLICTYWDENCLGLVPPEQVEGLYGCLDYYQAADDPFSSELLGRYEKLFPGSALPTGGGGRSGPYPGMRVWEAAGRGGGAPAPDAGSAGRDHTPVASR